MLALQRSRSSHFQSIPKLARHRLLSTLSEHANNTPSYLSRPGWNTIKHVARSVPTCVNLPDRGVLSVAGPGVGQFLDGLISGKMPGDGSRQHLYTVFLNAKGRILYDVFLYSNAKSETEPGYLIEYDSRPSEAQSLLQMLKRHLLRSKIRIRDVTEEYDVWALWNPNQLTYELGTEARTWECHPTGVIEPVFDEEMEVQWGSSRWGSQPGPIIDRRAIGFGQRVLTKRGNTAPSISSSFDEGTLDDYRVHRYLNGVPEGIEDMPPTHVFPANSSLDIMGALTFKKGCHVGQEHLSRARHVNELRRRLFPVIIHREGESVNDARSTPKPRFPPGIEVSSRSLHEAQPTAASRIKNQLVSNVHGVGLAMLRTEDVASCEDGKRVLEFESPVQEGGETVKWVVTPSKPSWWPDPRRGGVFVKNSAENIAVKSLDDLLLLQSLSQN
ncbi:Aminomethyltransferase folate-binding domain-containing protein [Cristinia sonorae]|uniref:Aminomethyltransferase folate-binding domain-containing protein n=1 Tax=Cristinia sonorae TaxID=1940300 RepID=A0A8K0UQ34_9AGAR|nr:Aminomethyltransferase folate-binding domain-containing protein [Cristinia sonorae]